jgi:hypothetical protein
MHPHLNWQQYAAVLRTIDVGLSLMYTPHPSYPPLDLAACGAVVVTNKHGSKQSLERYSDNIFCRDSTVDELVSGIRDAVRLANDQTERARNHGRTRLETNWNTSLAAALRHLDEV